MNLNSWQFYLSNLRPWLTLLIIAWLLGSVGLGWVVNSVVFIIAFLAIAPIIAFLGLQWWLRRNVVTAACPVCSFEFVGLKNTDVQCPSCGEHLAVKAGKFERVAPEGTIDVSVVDSTVVDSTVVDSTVVDVQVKALPRADDN